eukprot:Opistho-1_new@38577
MQDLEKLKYPIGKYEPPTEFTAEQMNLWIAALASLPQEIAECTANLDEDALAKVYRPNGWTVKQVIHHLADSHINAYTRVKLTLTEENPIIRPYFEDRWAMLPDGKDGDISLSIAILKAVHERLVLLLTSLSQQDFKRTYIHPEAQQQFSLAYLVGNYAWHGKHHLAHIKLTMK